MFRTVLKIAFGIVFLLTLTAAVAAAVRTGGFASPEFLVPAVGVIVLVVAGLFVAGRADADLLERFLANVGDLDGVRRDLFKLKADAKDFASAIQGAVASLDAERQELHAAVSGIDAMLHNDMEKIENELQDILGCTVETLHSLQRRLSMTKDEEKKKELSEIIAMARHVYKKAGLEPYAPDPGSAFDDRFCLIDKSSKSVTGALPVIDTVLTPGMLYKGNLLERAVVTVCAPAAYDDAPAAT